jgi:hypothetical protein
MRERLRGSLSTDAVIYLPFYLAYFGGDFEDTPFGSVDVKIVGLNDPIFKYYDEELVKSENKNLENPRLRGDDFMTLDVLFGVADIGIGDIGFVNILRYFNEAHDDKKTEKSLYKDVYDSTVKGGKTGVELYSQYFNDFQVEDVMLDSITKQDLEKRITETNLVVAGGLIRKPALKGIINNGDEKFVEKRKDFISSPSKDKNIKDTKLFTYPQFSTSYYYLKNVFIPRHYDKDTCQIELNDNIEIDFGQELLTDKIKDNICFSCDFVSLRFANKSKEGPFENYNIIQDLTTEQEMFWSGIILDKNKYNSNQDKYLAFFYALEKMTYTIDSYIKNNDRTGLMGFISDKLKKSESNINDIFNVLVADKTILKNITKKNSDDRYINLELTIRYIIKDLFYSERLYYNAVSISKKVSQDFNQPCEAKIKDIINLRSLDKEEKDNGEKIRRYSDHFIKEGVLYNVLEKWNKKQEKFLNYKYGVILLDKKVKFYWIKNIPVRVINKLRSRFYKFFKTKQVFTSISIGFTILSLISFFRPLFIFEKVGNDSYINYLEYEKCKLIADCILPELSTWNSIQYFLFEHFTYTVIPFFFIVAILMVSYLKRRVELLSNEKYVYRKRVK